MNYIGKYLQIFYNFICMFIIKYIETIYYMSGISVSYSLPCF